MKVTIQNIESIKPIGLIRRATFYDVNVMVRFSREELAIIRQRDLERVIVLRRDADAQTRRKEPAEIVEALKDSRTLRIGDLIYEADSYANATPFDARVYEQKLRDALGDLKKYLDIHAVPPRRGKETYQL